ncbi:MAG: DsrE family protein [Planctomycetota bacterium]
MKLAIVITSDPKTGEDGFGRAFQGMALAAEAKAAGDEVDIVFVGPGTRWPGELQQFDHPLNELYSNVRDRVQGASCACADAFGASDDLEACGVPKLTDLALPGTSGVASLRRYLADGWQTQVF